MPMILACTMLHIAYHATERVRANKSYVQCRHSFFVKKTHEYLPERPVRKEYVEITLGSTRQPRALTDLSSRDVLNNMG
jgi:hypothetical protein